MSKLLSFGGFVAALVLYGVFGIAGLATADNYPSKPITFVDPTTAGSGAARWSEVFAQHIQQYLGQPMEITFKPGGAANAEAVYIDQHPADGYTLGKAFGSLAGYMNLPGFKPHPDDFIVILRTDKQLFALGVLASSPFKSIKDVISYAKQHPGKLALGATKVGSVHQRHIINFEDAAGVKFKYIPYKGSGDVVKDVLGGFLPIGLAQPGLWLPLAKAGKVRMLILFNEDRIKALPNVPVPSDFGYKYEFTHQWYGAMVKKGTPPDRIKKLQAAFHKVVESEAYKQYLAANPGVEPIWSDDQVKLTKELAKSRGEFRAYMKSAGLIK